MMPKVSYKKARRTYGLAFRLAFALSTLCFVSATVYTQYRLTGVEEAAATIEAVASPSIESLLKAREALNEVGLAATDLVAESRRGGISDPGRLYAALERLRQHSSAYLGLKLLPFEGDKWKAIDKGVKDVTRTAHALAESVEARSGESMTQYYLENVQPAILRLSDAIPPTIAHDASVAKDLAREISKLHDESLRVVVFLDALSLLLAVFSAVIVYMPTWDSVA